MPAVNPFKSQYVFIQVSFAILLFASHLYCLLFAIMLFASHPYCYCLSEYPHVYTGAAFMSSCTGFFFSNGCR